MEENGCQILHGAAVGLPNGGVLLAGRGGSGKSTTSVACLDSDLLHVGDDWVLLQRQPAPVIHALYNSVKLHPDHLRKRLPQLLGMVSNLEKLDTEKAIVFLNKHYKHKLINSFPLKAIVLLRVTGNGGGSIKKASAFDVLMGLIPDTCYVDHSNPERIQKNLENLTQLAKGLPTYRLEVGSDLPAIAAAILDLLSKI
jgi:hypothetical protein